jgi:broad specificity phosphatase PhoE
MEIVVCEHARERNFGVLEGRSSADHEDLRPPIHFIKVGNDYHSMDIPSGETLEELRARAERFHRFVLDNYLGRRVLVVSHGVFLQQYHGVLRGQDWIEALSSHVGNLEMTMFHMDGDMIISEERKRLIGRGQSEF